jgi:hypothetical protein
MRKHAGLSADPRQTTRARPVAHPPNGRARAARGKAGEAMDRQAEGDAPFAREPRCGSSAFVASGADAIEPICCWLWPMNPFDQSGGIGSNLAMMTNAGPGQTPVANDGMLYYRPDPFALQCAEKAFPGCNPENPDWQLVYDLLALEHGDRDRFERMSAPALLLLLVRTLEGRTIQQRCDQARATLDSLLDRQGPGLDSALAAVAETAKRREADRGTDAATPTRKPKRRPNLTDADKIRDAGAIAAHLIEHPDATRDQVAEATGICGTHVSQSKAWKAHAKRKEEARKANRPSGRLPED